MEKGWKGEGLHLFNLAGKANKAAVEMREKDEHSSRLINEIGKSVCVFAIDATKMTREEHAQELAKIDDLYAAAEKVAMEKVAISTALYESIEQGRKMVDDRIMKMGYDVSTFSDDDDSDSCDDYDEIKKANETRTNRSNYSNNREIRKPIKKIESGSKKHIDDDISDGHIVRKKKMKNMEEKGISDGHIVRKKKMKKMEEKEVAKETVVPLVSDEAIEEVTDGRLYCFCQKVESGSMVRCDNYYCDYEWFHFKCVGITVAKLPKNVKWYCFGCRRRYERVENQWDYKKDVNTQD